MMKQQELTDQQLVRMYRRGDEQALQTLIERHREKIFTSIMMFTKDRYKAEDIFQDTFIKVIKPLRGGNYKEEGKFLPWVTRIAYNLCVDQFRRNKRAPMIATEEGFDIFDVLTFSDENAEDRIMRTETQSKVRRLIDELPAEQKQVVILRHFAGLSFKEISELTNVSINTALGRMRYALINMRKTIAEKEISL